jgi:serine/threonine protein kinase
LIGRTLGHYEVIEKAGEGGMGAVYKARDIRLGRTVALKTLPGESVANPERKQRFALEARAASALNHPNIITIYDIDVADGVDFIAMEYVAGHTLADLIPPGGMEPARAIQFAAQIADALATAHQSGIVHRDLKPSNIMVNQQGRVKVLDFGLAKLIEPVSAAGAATQTGDGCFTIASRRLSRTSLLRNGAAARIVSSEQATSSVFHQRHARRLLRSS